MFINGSSSTCNSTCSSGRGWAFASAIHHVCTTLLAVGGIGVGQRGVGAPCWLRCERRTISDAAAAWGGGERFAGWGSALLTLRWGSRRMMELSDALASSTARMRARIDGSVSVGSSDQSVEFAPSRSLAASMALELEAIAGRGPWLAGCSP